MHILFGRILKYFLWFVFCVVLGAFLYGFAKFKFQPTLYIQYLNGIDIQQLFESSPSAVSTGSLLSGDLNTTGNDGIYDPTIDADIFGQTGNQQSGDIATGTTSESFGFVKNSGTTGTTLDSSESTNTGSATIMSGDAKQQLLNLLKKEK